jgi:regulatory protein
MLIVEIKKKDNFNVIVYLDNNDKIYLSYEVLLKNGLRKGSEISESHFNFLVMENQKYFIKQKAYAYLGKRIHSVSELKTKLRQKKYAENLINETLDELLRGKYLDDMKFAEVFSDEKIRLKLWGRTKLKSELIRRGISREIISVILESKFENEGGESEKAFMLAEKKYQSLKGRKLDKKKLGQRLYSFLISKGYNFEISKQAVEKLFCLTLEEDKQ